MKLITVTLLLLTSVLSAADPLFFPDSNISVVSAFDTKTFITTYSSEGEPVWEVVFDSEVVSWNQKENHLLVFSKARNDVAYFLTCIDVVDGNVIWEKGIMAPGS